MSTVQKFLGGLLLLGAGYLVIANPNGFASAAKGIEGLTAGSITQITHK